MQQSSIGASKKNLRMRYPEGLEFQFPNVSSSVIRERLQRNQSISHLVPKKVDEYIRIHKLYRA